MPWCACGSIAGGSRGEAAHVRLAAATAARQPLCALPRYGARAFFFSWLALVRRVGDRWVQEDDFHCVPHEKVLRALATTRGRRQQPTANADDGGDDIDDNSQQRTLTTAATTATTATNGDSDARHD